MGDLGQRVVLIHKLGQLGRAKELFHCGCHRLGIDQILRHQAFRFGKAQAFFDRTLNTHQPYTELVFGHFTHRTYATVTQMVDIIHHPVTVTDIHQGSQYFNDVGGLPTHLLEVLFAFFIRARAKVATVIEDTWTRFIFTTKTTVELHPAHCGQVIPLISEEQVFEQVFGGFFRRRLTRAHHSVNLDQRLQRRTGRIGTKGVCHERPVIQVVCIECFKVSNATLLKLLQRLRGQLGITLHQNLTGILIDDRLGQVLALQVLGRDIQVFDVGFFQLANVACRDTTTTLHHDLTISQNIEGRCFTTQTLRHQLHAVNAVFHCDFVGVEEHLQHFVRGIPQRTQQDGRRQFAATVDPYKDLVFRIELEIQPGTTVRNHPGRIKQLAGRVSLAFIVVEEHTGGPVQLGHDYPFGTINNEGAVFGHQGNLTHIDLLFTNIFNRPG